MRTTTYILLFSLLVALDSAFAKNAASPVCVTHFLEFDTSDKALKRKAVVIDSALKLLLQKYDKQAAIRYIDPRSIGDSSLVIPDSISAQAKDIASSYLTSKGVDVEVVLNVRLSPDPAGIEVVFESRYCETGRILHQLRLTFIPQNSPQETSQLIDAALKTILAELNESRTAYGFPFAENDRGVIVVVDESPDSLLLPVLDSFGALFAAMPADSVIFRFFKPSPVDSPAKNFAHRLLDSAGQTGARIVLEPVFDDSTKTLSHISYCFPPDQISKPYIFVRLPIRPAIDELCCAAVESDSLMPDVLSSLLAASLSGEFAPGELANAGDAEETVSSLAEQFDRVLKRHKYLSGNAAPSGMDTVFFAAVESAYRALLKSARDSSITSAWIYLNYADLKTTGGHYDSALSFLDIADSLASQNADTLLQAICHLQKGFVFNHLNSYDKAMGVYGQALTLFGALSDSQSVAEITNRMALQAEAAGEAEKAFSFYERGARLYNSLHDPYKTAEVYFHISQLARNTQDYEKAEEYAAGYLRMVNELKSEPALARGYFQMGLATMALQRDSLAIENFKKAADYMELLGDSSGLSRVDNNLGLLYRQRGDLAEAKARLESALQLSQAVNDAGNAIQCRMNLGDLAMLQKDFENAQLHYDEALLLAHSLNDDRQIAMITYAKGLMHLKEGRLRTGYYEIKEALEKGGGAVNGTAEQEQEFLKKLEKLIREIQEIQETKLNTPAKG